MSDTSASSRPRFAAAYGRLESLFSSAPFGAALLLAAAAQLIFRIRAAGEFFYYPAHLDSGMSLYLGVLSPSVSSFMPLLSLPVALAHLGLSGAQQLWAVGALKFCSLLVVRRAALRASGPAAANAALVLLLGAELFASREGGLDPEQALLSFLAALFIYFLTRAEKMFTRDYALAGLGLGLTLLIRSTLLALPFALAAVFAALAERRDRALYKNLAVFVLCSYVLLVPWTRLNYAVHGEFIPFEKDRSGYNIVTGVKGTMAGMEGDWRRLAGLGPRDSVYRWAIAEIAGDPAGYIFSTVRRTGYILLFHPFLLLAALLACARVRSRALPLFLAVALYFIFMHSLISVVPRYLYPLRFLLAAPAAAFFFHRPAAAAGRREIFPAALFGAALAFALIVEVFVLAYPQRSAAGATPDTGSPGARDWLLRRKIYAGLKSAGDAEKLSLIEEYLSIPGHKDRDLDYIHRVVNAGPGEELPAPPGLNPALFWVKALKELDREDYAAARETKKGLLNAYRSTVLLRDLPSEREMDAESREKRAPGRGGDAAARRELAVEAELYSSHEGMLQKYLYDSLFYMPSSRRCALLLRADRELGVRLDEKALGFTGRQGDIPGLLACVAASKLRPGDFSGAGFPLSAVFGVMDAALREGDLKFIGELLRADNAPEAEMTSLFAAAAEKAGTAELPGLLLAPAGPVRESLFRYFLAGGAVAQDKRGALFKEARAALAKKSDLLYIAARRLGEKGKKEESKKIFTQLSEKGYFDTPEKRRELFFLLQQGGDYAAALAVADRLLREKPSAEGYNDRGVLLRLMGRSGAAVKDFERAAALDPGLAEAGLNLASLYKMGGREKEACALLRRVMAGPDGPPRDDAAAAFARDCGDYKN